MTVGEILHEVSLEYDLDAFEEHDSGMRLPKEALALLLDAAHKLKARPSVPVLLEGHTPGRPQENDALRESIGEEAADFCKDKLQEAGVSNELRCVGLGSLHGLGLRVRLLLLPPSEEDVTTALQKELPPEKPVEECDKDDDDVLINLPPLPEGEAERVELLDRLLQEQLQAGPIHFQPNSAAILPSSRWTIRRVAKLLQAFQDLSVQISGIAKGRPRENNSAKRQLSTARAQSVRKALQQEGVSQQIVAFGFGSALGGSLDMWVNALPARKSASVPDHEFCIVPRPWSASEEQERDVLNQLLKELLLQSMALEPNKATVAVTPQLRMVAAVLRAYPHWTIRCEGHAKGKPEENNLAKRQLSLGRAEAFRASLKELGLRNDIRCAGEGSAKGLGIAVRMYAMEPRQEMEVPNIAGLSQQEQRDALDGLLQHALPGAMLDFVPNKVNLPESANEIIDSLAKIIKAFPASIRLCCEAHTRGFPEEDGEAKRRLSKARAELFKGALAARGVTNFIVCKGAGSSQGLGPCIRMSTTEEVSACRVEIPDVSGLTEVEQHNCVNSLLVQILQKEQAIHFSANSYEVPASAADTIAEVARVLSAFPGLAFRCEGHSKGQSSEDSKAKQRLSYLRAEAVKAALKKAGANNLMACVGKGSSLGTGTGIQMFVIDREEAEATCCRVQIPADTAALGLDERRQLLERLLKEALQGGLKFEANTMELQMTSMIVVCEAAAVLKAFPDVSVNCIGHAKGKPEDNSEARVKLSLQRAEAVRQALVAEGVTNELICHGAGSSKGLGSGVQLSLADGSSGMAVRGDETQAG